MNKLLKLLVLGLSFSMLTACGGGNKGNQGDSGYDDGSGQHGGDDGGKTDDDGNQYSDDTTAQNLVSYTIADYADNAGWENATKYSSFNLDSVVTISSKGNANTGKYYENGENYRLYASESATLTIAVSEGHTLKSVNVTYTSQDGCKLNKLESGQTIGVRGTSATFGLSSNKGQVRITALEIGYDGTKGEDPFYRDAWNADEKAIIYEKLHGVDIPFVYFPGIVLEYSDFSGIYVEISNVKLADLNTYAGKFEESTVWTNISDEGDTNDLIFEAEITTDAGKRFVYAELLLLDSDNQLIASETEIGTMYIALSDPYYYEWDADLMDEIVADLKSTATVPEYEGLVRYQILENEEEEGCIFYLYEETEAKFLAYKEKFTGWTVSEITTGSDESFGSYKTFNAIPATDDLFVEVSIFSEHNIVLIEIDKRLPHLAEFPMAAVKEYNGGVEIPVPQGASYFTAENLDMIFDFFDETFVIPVGYDVIAYGIDETEFAAYEALFATGYEVEAMMDEDDEGNTVATGYKLVSFVTENHLLYQFSYGYDAEEEMLDMTFDGPSSTYIYDTWAAVAEDYNSFKTAKGLTFDLPELTVGEGETYRVNKILDDEEYFDQFGIVAKGNKVEAWLGILRTAGFDIPTEPDEEYGYECVHSTGEVEIDVAYDEEDDITYATLYKYADLLEG